MSKVRIEIKKDLNDALKKGCVVEVPESLATPIIRRGDAEVTDKPITGAKEVKKKTLVIPTHKKPKKLKKE